MVSNRCLLIVKSELDKFGFHYRNLVYGEVEVEEDVGSDILNRLNVELNRSGLALIHDNRSILIEKIKVCVIDLIHYQDTQLKINFSDYLSEKLNYDYTYLANIFSENLGITIEHFLLNHRIERVKELLVYDELNITEIAYKMHYSSAAHLSNQFKKMTGMTPSHYKHLKLKRRTPIENI